MAITDNELSLDSLKTRYPQASKQVIKALHEMDHDKIQYPLIEKLVVSQISELLGISLDTNPKKQPDSKKKKKNGKSKETSPSDSLASSQPASPSEKPYRGILIFLPGYAEISFLYELLLQNENIKKLTGYELKLIKQDKANSCFLFIRHYLLKNSFAYLRILHPELSRVEKVF